MTDVKITELRQNLPEYLARASRGERLRDTSRGRPIAEIAPPAAAPSPADARARLTGSVKRFDRPTEPVVAPQDWEATR